MLSGSTTQDIRGTEARGWDVRLDWKSQLLGGGGSTLESPFGGQLPFFSTFLQRRKKNWAKSPNSQMWFEEDFVFVKFLILGSMALACMPLCYSLQTVARRLSSSLEEAQLWCSPTSITVSLWVRYIALNSRSCQGGIVGTLQVIMAIAVLQVTQYY